jgi:hypothetical protein
VILLYYFDDVFSRFYQSFLLSASLELRLVIYASEHALFFRFILTMVMILAKKLCQRLRTIAAIALLQLLDSHVEPI